MAFICTFIHSVIPSSYDHYCQHIRCGRSPLLDIRRRIPPYPGRFREVVPIRDLTIKWRSNWSFTPAVTDSIGPFYLMAKTTVRRDSLFRSVELTVFGQRVPL